jgi:exoribonuclease R
LNQGKCKSKENIHYSILIECPEHFPRELSVKTKNLNYRALDGCEVVFSVHQQPEGKKEEKPDQPPEEQAAQGRSVRRKDGERQMAKVLFVLKSPFEGRMSILKISRDLHGGPNKYIGRCVYKKKYPEFTIEEESLSKFQGKLADHYYVAQYKEWDPMKKAPLIRLVEPIGPAGAIPVEFQCLAKTLNVELQGFSFEEEDAVAEECAQMLAHKYEFDPEHFQDRFDLSNMLAISVGSKHAQAASVAFSVVDKGEGKLELGVHTPDLTYYVKPGSQADLLAKARLNSASLPHKHFGILPDFLEQGPCSLVPGSSRLATSLYFLIDDQGEIVPGSTKLFKTIIQVSAFIPFELAADIAEGQLADFPADFVSFSELL